MLFMSRARGVEPRFRNDSLPQRDVAVSVATREAVEDLRARFEAAVHNKPYQPISLLTPSKPPAPPVVVAKPPVAPIVRPKAPLGTWPTPPVSTNLAMNRIATAVFLAGAPNEAYWLQLMQTIGLDRAPFTSYAELRDAMRANDFTSIAQFPSDDELARLADLLEWYFVPLELYARDVATTMHSLNLAPFRQRRLVQQYVANPGVPLWAASDARMERTIRVDRLQYVQDIFRQGPVQNNAPIVASIRARRSEWMSVKRVFIDKYDTYVHDKPSPSDLQLMIATIEANVPAGDELWEQILGLDDLRANPLDVGDEERVLKFYEAFSLYQLFLPIYKQAAVTNNGTFDQGLVLQFEADVKNAPLGYYDEALGTAIVDAMRAYLTQLPQAAAVAPAAAVDQASVDRYDRIAAKYAFFYNEELEIERIYGQSNVDDAVQAEHDAFANARASIDFTDAALAASELDRFEQWIDDRRVALIDVVDQQADTLRANYNIDSPQWDAEKLLPEPELAVSLVQINRAIEDAFQRRYSELDTTHAALVVQKDNLLAQNPSLDLQHVDALLTETDQLINGMKALTDRDLLQIDAELKTARTLLIDIVEREVAAAAAAVPPPPQQLIDDWRAEKALATVPDVSRFYADFAALLVPPPPPPLNTPPSPLIAATNAAAKRQALLADYLRLRAVARRFPELPALLPHQPDLEAMERNLNRTTARGAASKLKLWSQMISNVVESAVQESNDSALVARLPTSGPLDVALMEQLMDELESSDTGRQAIAKMRAYDLAAQARDLNVAESGDEQELEARLSTLVDNERTELQSLNPAAPELSLAVARGDYAALHAILDKAITSAKLARDIAQQEADQAGAVDELFTNQPGPPMSTQVPQPPVEAQLQDITTQKLMLESILASLSAEQRRVFGDEYPALNAQIAELQSSAPPADTAAADAVIRETALVTGALQNTLKRIQLSPLDKCVADLDEFVALARAQVPPLEPYQVDQEIERLFPTQPELQTLALISASNKELADRFMVLKRVAKEYRDAEKSASAMDAVLADAAIPDAVRAEIETAVKYQPPPANAQALMQNIEAKRKVEKTLKKKLTTDLNVEKAMYDCYRRVSAYRNLLDRSLDPVLFAKADALVARGFDVSVFERANSAYLAELDALTKEIETTLPLQKERAASYKEFLDEQTHFRSLYIYATQPPERPIL